MRRRSLETEIMAALAVASVVAAAALVAYVAISEVAAAARSGLLDRAFQMGAAALLAVVVAVVTLAGWSRWRTVTEPPDRPRRRRRPPTRVEMAGVSVLLAALVTSSWPVLVHSYRGALEAFSTFDLAWAVGYAVAGVAFLWLVVWSVVRYVRWQHRWVHTDQGTLA